MTSTDTQRGPDTELVIERRLEAPRELVWRAWTDADHLTAWCRPQGFTTRVDAHEFRVGGRWRYVMIGPDGVEYPSEGMFIEIDRPSRVVSTDKFAADHAPPKTGMALPGGIHVALNFKEAGEETDVTVRISHPSVEARRAQEGMGIVTGWNSSLDQLAGYLEQLQSGV